jgi:hypothetical protein
MPAEELSVQVEEYLRDHPEIGQALRVFRISMDEYERAFREPSVSTANTTNYVEG